MGRLNWNGHSQPKLSYKGEGLERLFLQLIKTKLTNPDKFLQNIEFPLFVTPARISEKIPPVNISFEILVPPILQRGGGLC